MVEFIDQHKNEFGVESICAILPIAPSTYYRYKKFQNQPYLCSLRTKRDNILSQRIYEIWFNSHGLYGRCKIYHQLLLDVIKISYGTVHRLMNSMDIQGVSRGKAKKASSQKADVQSLPDLVERQFTANRGCGHLPYLEKPQHTCSVIDNFLLSDTQKALVG